MDNMKIILAITISFKILTFDIEVFAPFKSILCIYYPIWFKKDNKAKIQALINFSNFINILALAYIVKLDLKVRFTNIGALKINDSTLDI